VFGKPKGYIFIKKRLEHTREPGFDLLGRDLTKIYFEALQLRLVPVLDIAIDNSSYLVLGKSKEVGSFIWDIDKQDTTGEIIPYKLLHPNEPDIEDFLDLLRSIIPRSA